MNTTWRSLWRMSAFLMSVAVISCSTVNNDSASNMTSDKAKLIARQLQRCPLWTEVSGRDLKRREQITETYLSLARYDTPTIRAGIVLYINRSPFLSLQRDEAGEKVYAFLRVIFQVPRRFEGARKNLPYGLMGNPIYADGVDLLWPFSMGDHGHLRLTGVMEGAYTGVMRNPVVDFDQMAVRLPRRFPASR